MTPYLDRTDAAEMLTDERIVEIRDEHLPSQGDSFDCIAFARAIEAEVSQGAVNSIGLGVFAWGVSRCADNPKSAMVSFRREPTDDELRALHEALRPMTGQTVRTAAQASKEPKARDFRDDLTGIINRYSKENGSDTPDFILADYLLAALDAFNHTVRNREAWYGREAKSVESAAHDHPGAQS